MPAGPSTGATDDLAAALRAALAAGTREAFTVLLTDDVRWGGEHGGDACSTRDQAGDHYAGLLDAGVVLQLDEVEQAGPALIAHLQVRSPDPDAFPSQLRVRVTLRDGLIADLRELDPPETIEVLYVDGCPHLESFLPHLRGLLADHGLSAAISLTRIEDEDDARAHRFLGSPTVRVDGHDVEPDADARHLRRTEQTGDPDGRYGLQCRLYPAGDGTAGTPRDAWILAALIDDPVHEAAVAAVRAGDVPALRQLLAEQPGLASLRLPRHGGRSLLHVATDWPGHRPHVAATIATLVAAGADPDLPSLGEHGETPLHWAASCDDVAAIDALLDSGADINAPGAVIGGGTPMADATAFGQWAAARRLYERDARTTLFEAAALGLVTEVQRHLADGPAAEEVTSSFWGACHGGHVSTAAVLLDHGADVNWVGYDDLTPLDAAHRSEAAAVVDWLRQRGGVSADRPG